MYGRNRKNIFGMPSSITTGVNMEQELLKVPSRLMCTEKESAYDLNNILFELWEDDRLNEVCKSNNQEQFLKFLFDKGIMKNNTDASVEYSKGWFTTNAYIAANTYGMVYLQVLAVVGVFAYAIVAPKPPEEETNSSYIKQVRNPVLNTCQVIAHKLGGVSFGNKINDLFYGLENGKYQILTKNGEYIVDIA